MKRVGNLYDRIWQRENLLLAYHGASKGKRASGPVRTFATHLDANLCEIADSLRVNGPRFGDYRRFLVRDPKERVICAASFRERVIHHAVINVCGSWLERPLVNDTYACRRGKGQFKALDRAQFHARRFPFFLKMDVRRYFDSVDHGVLLRLLDRMFKDERLLALFRALLASYETDPGKGLPIGNLTSQYFANLYLSPMDHAVEEQKLGHGSESHAMCTGGSGSVPTADDTSLPSRYRQSEVVPPSRTESDQSRVLEGRAPSRPLSGQLRKCVSADGCFGYVRYMDDMLVFGERDMLKTLRAAVEGYLRDELKLQLKDGGFINRCGLGIEFLGFRVFPDRLRLNTRSRRRFVRKLEWLDRAMEAGEMGEDTYQARSTALFSFVQHADTLAFRKRVLGKGHNRIEPAETGGQLEQRRAELPFGQPQQQQPVEPQQQHRFSAGCLSGSSTRLSDERSLNRPLSGSRVGGTKSAAAPGLVALANGPRAAFFGRNRDG